MKLGINKQKIATTLLLAVAAFMTTSNSVVSALSQADLHSIYNDTPWYKIGGSLGLEPSLCGGSFDSFLKALAFLESGGNPTAENPGSGASGKYQYLTDTWQSTTSTYYPPATQYARALQAPESYQDATTYILFALRSKQTSGDLFKMAVAHYYPDANRHPNLLDVIPPGNVLTPRQYANQVIQNMASPKAQALPLKYAEAPEFQTYLAKVGAPEIAASTCSCSEAIVAMAKNYAWPTYSSFLLTLKPAYRVAIEQPGVYVGGPPPGVDCGAYVTRVLIDSGADPGYNYGGKTATGAGNTATQKKYLDEQVAAGKYENLGTVSDTSKLLPGDIAITANTHTYLFLGDQGFAGYDSASSSQGERAPMASSSYFTDSNGVPFTWYRLKCPLSTGGQEGV